MLNSLQRPVLEVVFDYIIQNKDRFYVIKKNQLLVYIRREREIRKSYVIYMLEIGFTLPNRRDKLMILLPKIYVTEGIGEYSIFKFEY